MYVSTSDFHVGFAYLASALKKAGHEVFGLNPNNDSSFSSAYDMLNEKIECALRESQPELIGIGGLCTDYHSIRDGIKIIRELEPDVPIVCGGGIVTHDKDFIFQALSPDFCISGEGEEIIVQLARMLESGKQEYERIDNLGYWKDGVPKFSNQNFKYGPIDEISFPDYELFDWEEMLGKFQLANRYTYRYTRTDPRVMPFVAARGCPFSCTFCVHQLGVKYRARSIENIIREISLLYERYHFNILIFNDELFAAKRERVKKFCHTLIEARKTLGWDFDWNFQTHASASLNKDDFNLLKEAGCYLFSYGLESASPKVLTSMKKKSKPSQIAEGIRIANSAGIGYGANLIFGDVAETKESISESMDFFSKHCLDNHLQFASIQLYPGSKIFDVCMERGIIERKIEYYENIRKHYNATLMSDRLWMLWSRKMGSLGRSFSWVKSSDALSCRKYNGTGINPMTINYGQYVWNVSARCPHCENEVHFRELLGTTAQKKADTYVRTEGHFFHRIVKFYHRNKKTGDSFLSNFLGFVFKLTRRIGEKFAAVLMEPIIQWLNAGIFKSLQPLMPHEGQKHAPNSFVTGCPSCNKRFRVNINSTLR